MTEFRAILFLTVGMMEPGRGVRRHPGIARGAQGIKAEQLCWTACVPTCVWASLWSTCLPVGHLPLPPFPGSHHGIGGMAEEKRATERRQGIDVRLLFLVLGRHETTVRFVPGVGRWWISLFYEFKGKEIKRWRDSFAGLGTVRNSSVTKDLLCWVSEEENFKEAELPCKR